ncbi:14-3-3 protein, partial [Exidia glandulosa HHB12029]
MVALMRHVVTFEQELTVDERNLFSVAYKELVGLRRKSLRRLGDLATELLPSSEHERALLLAMQKDVRDELVALCNEALDTIERALLPRSILSESTVFYHKMTADYLRYLAEFSGADERRGYADRASEAYARARELAQSHGLSATNPVRLGLALNLSVFEFEIRSDVREAFEVAAEALAEARENVEEMLEAHRKDATLIMQLLRDNLQLWS